MDHELKENITAKQTWLRGFFILMFAFLLTVARVVTWAVVFLQFLFSLFTGKANGKLLALGASLSRFIYQCLLFVTFNSDVKPFPFADWPSDEEQEVPPAKSALKKSTAKKATVKKAGVKKASKKKSATRKPDASDAEAKQTSQQESVIEASESAVSEDSDSESTVVENKLVEQPGSDTAEPGEEGEKPAS